MTIIDQDILITQTWEEIIAIRIMQGIILVMVDQILLTVDLQARAMELELVQVLMEQTKIIIEQTLIILVEVHIKMEILILVRICSNRDNLTMQFYYLQN